MGSGVLNFGGFLEINSSTLTNTHGGLASINGQTSINKSVIVSNFIVDDALAAGIYARSSFLDVTSSSIIHNQLREVPPLWGTKSAVGLPSLLRIGIKAGGAVTLLNSDSHFVNSTISGNKGFIGGLVVMEPPPWSIAFPSKRGGSVFSTTLSHVTLSDNVGVIGGLAIDDNLASLRLEGTIITGNKSLVTPEFANGYVKNAAEINMNAYNFIGENGDPNTYGFPLGTSDHIFNNAASDNLYPLNLSNGQFVHPL